MPPKITTIGPELLREIRAVIAAERARVAGQLRDDLREPPKAPDDYMVLTPRSGIPARIGQQIVSRKCDVYREVSTDPANPGAAKSLVKIRDGNGKVFQLSVFNVHCAAVPGRIIVPTALLKGGTRYVVGWEDCESESESSPSSSPSSSPPSPSSPSSSPSSSPPSSPPSNPPSSPSSSPSSSPNETSWSVETGDCFCQFQCSNVFGGWAWSADAFTCGTAYPPWGPPYDYDCRAFSSQCTSDPIYLTPCSVPYAYIRRPCLS